MSPIHEAARSNRALHLTVPIALVALLSTSLIAGAGAAVRRPVATSAAVRATSAAVHCDLARTRVCGPYNGGVDVIVRLPAAPSCLAGTSCQYALVANGAWADDPTAMAANPIANGQQATLDIQTSALDSGRAGVTVWYYPIAGSDMKSYGREYLTQFEIELVRN